MSCSFADFTDNIFRELSRVGAITVQEQNAPKLDDIGLQNDYALNAIARLVEVRDAAVARRDALIAWGNRDVLAPRDIKLLEAVDAADKRLAAALEAVKQPSA